MVISHHYTPSQMCYTLKYHHYSPAIDNSKIISFLFILCSQNEINKEFYRKAECSFFVLCMHRILCETRSQQKCIPSAAVAISPAMHAPSPSAMHAPCHACPMPCTLPCHACPPPCTLPCHACPMPCTHPCHAPPPPEQNHRRL